MSTSTSLGDLLRTAVSPVVPLTEGQIAAMELHFELLIRWNEKLNLTAITDPAEAAVRHYGEAVFLASRLGSGSAVDVGSGPGFPGVPAAIFRPELAFDLVESNQRKAVFLRECTRHLPNVRILSVRAQDVIQEYDWLIARAVALDELLGLKVGRRRALLIGTDKASRLTGFEVTPLPWGERRVLAIG